MLFLSRRKNFQFTRKIGWNFFPNASTIMKVEYKFLSMLCALSNFILFTLFLNYNFTSQSAWKIMTKGKQDLFNIINLSQNKNVWLIVSFHSPNPFFNTYFSFCVHFACISLGFFHLFISLVISLHLITVCWNL